MKKLVILLGCILCMQVFLCAQQPVYKYGKVSAEEIGMLRYDADTSAAAVVLYEEGITAIEYSEHTGFIKKTNVWKRLKILKEEGKQYADIEIPYYDSGQLQERVEGVEAYVYNQEGEKVSKIKMERSYISTEQDGKLWYRVKFSIPNVKEGSVIEYKYTIVSDLYWSIPVWYFQGSIPVQKSIFEVKLYEYFSFNELTQGYEPIRREEKDVAVSIGLNNGIERSRINCNSRQITYTGTNLPAVKNESFVWNIRQYCSAVDMEIRAMQLPNSMLKDFGINWESIDERLADDSDFGKRLTISNPFSEEVGKIMATGMTDFNKARAICNLVKKEVAWNGSYDLYATNPKEAAKKKIGSNADINFLVLAALRETGFNTNIILVRSRTNGMIRLERASLNTFNSFVVEVTLPDGSKFYFDGSASSADLNVLSPRFLVEKGKVFRKGNTWVDLRRLTENKYVHNALFTVGDDGMASGKYLTAATNQCAYFMFLKKRSFATEDQYLAYLEKETGTEIGNIEMGNKNDTISEKCTRMIEFKKQFTCAGDYIYINPFVEIYDDESAMNASERKYPIEFSYPLKLTYTASITIPDGYVIAELPRSAGFTMDDVGARTVFTIGSKGNLISLRLVTERNQEMILAKHYASFRIYWQKMCEIYKGIIVLKKAEPGNQPT